MRKEQNKSKQDKEEWYGSCKYNNKNKDGIH